MRNGRKCRRRWKQKNRDMARLLERFFRIVDKLPYHAYNRL